MKPRIVIIVPYFGDWPEWIEFFLESCRANESIDWILLGDAEPPQNRSKNVRFIITTFADYLALLSEALQEKIAFAEPYKLCDIRPALPFVHADLVADYDFVGFGDLDVIYGDIRSFYDDRILGQYDLFSSHSERISGHLCIMRNRDDVITAFKRAPGWKATIRTQAYTNFDERGLHRLFRGRVGRLVDRVGLSKVRCFFREAYTTPGATERMTWFWKDGELTNEFYPGRPFMYLHFMSWHSNRWYSSQPNISRGTPAPWTLLDRVVRMDWRDARSEGFAISPKGIEPIPAAG